MRLRQLEYFVAVAEESSFTRAAATLGVSQPVVSRQIRALENELRTQLLVRTSRNVTLTRAGERLLPEAYHILHRVETAREVVAGDRETRLRIGTYSTAGLMVMRNSLAEYKASYQQPGVEVSVLRWDEMGPAIRDGHVDAGFITTAAEHRFSDYEGLSMVRLMIDPRVAVLRRDHDLAGTGELSINDLTPYNLVRTTGLSTAQCDWWNVSPRPDGALPRGPRTATTVSELFDVVSLTGDVAITTESSAELRDRVDIEFIPLVDVDPAAVYVAWSEAANPLTWRFVGAARRAAKALG